MSGILATLNGKKTYILMAIFCILALFGKAPTEGIKMPDATQLQEVVFAAGLAAMRAGIAKVTTQKQQ